MGNEAKKPTIRPFPNSKKGRSKAASIQYPPLYKHNFHQKTNGNNQTWIMIVSYVVLR